MGEALMPVARGVLAALGGAGVVLLLDLWGLPPDQLSWRVALVLAAVLVPLYMAAGGLLALVSRVVARLARQTPGRGRLSFEARAGLVWAALLWTPMVLLVSALATGRQASRWIGPLAARLALATLLVLIVAVALRALLGLRSRIVRATSPAWTALVSLLLLALAAALFAADALLFRRLYAAVHATIHVVYFLCVFNALTLVFLRFCPSKSRATWRQIGFVLLLGGALAAGIWARQELADDAQLRFVAVESTTATGKLLTLWPPRVEPRAPGFLADQRAGRPKGGAAGLRVPEANVVLVSVDALRPDHLGAYGYKRPTSPNIDALSRRAVRFDAAYCQAPLTCYSVPSLHTGDYLKSTLPLLSRPPATLAQVLTTRGYTTAAFFNASIFFCDDKRATGFGKRRFGFAHAETRLRAADQLTNRVMAYLRRFRAGGGKKLFLWVHYFDAHEPYREEPGFHFGQRDVDRYDSEIAFVDQALGRLMVGIGRLAGPTIFILTSDHGEEFGEHGGNYHGSSLYDEQVRVPLIIGVPGLKPRTSAAPAQLVDVMPTVLDLLGVPLPASVRGRSLVPDLLGKADPNASAFSEVHAGKMVRRGRWKLIHDFRRGTYQLYDLGADPGERTNLISRRPDRAARLKGVLHGWFDRLRAVGAQQDRPEAIDLGRIGDRRARDGLQRLVGAPGESRRWRVEAARLLGQMHDRRAADSLWQAVADDDRALSDEAVIALGEVQDRRALTVLPGVLARTNGDTRQRAGIGLARVQGPARMSHQPSTAAPALVEGLLSNRWKLQHRAAHYLGFVGDAASVAPLLRMGRRPHLRSRCGLALGRLGARVKDRRIFPFLLGQIRQDHHADVHQRAVAALGYLGDRRAIDPLLTLLKEGKETSWAAESLVRLDAVGRRIAGVDLAPDARGRLTGWGRCHRSRSSAVDRFRNATWCEASANATLELNRRKTSRARLLLRARSLRSGQRAATVRVLLNGRPLGPKGVTGSWQELKFEVPARNWRRGKNRVELRPDDHSGPSPALAVDHLLVIPD